LNRDYAKRNADTSGIPSYYSSLAADCGFQFALANLDTNGNATTGIVRRQTNVQAFDLNDGIKFSSEGGDDGWDRDRYLNIWVGNLTGGTLGYSSVIGGPKPNDGVTVLTIELNAGTYTLEVLFNPQWPGMSSSDFKTPSSVPLSQWSTTSHP